MTFDRTFVRTRLFAGAALVAIGLTGCGAGGPSVGPVDPGTTAPVSVEVFVQQIIAGARRACQFEPQFDFVRALIGSSTPGSALIVSLVNEICDAAEKAKASPNAGAIRVRGVGLRGHFVRQVRH